MSARVGRAASAGFPLAPASPPHPPHGSVRQRSRPVRASVAVSSLGPVLHCCRDECAAQHLIAFGDGHGAAVRLHQPPERNGVLIVPGVALEPFAPGTPTRLGNAERRSRSATARARGAPPRFPRFILQASSPPEHPASRHCAARRSKLIVVLAARAPVSASKPLPAHLSCVVVTAHPILVAA